MPGRSEEARGPGGWIPPRAHQGVALSLLAAILGAALADLVVQNQPSLVVLVVVPLTAAVLVRVRATITLSILCALLSLVLPGSLFDHGSLRLVRVAGTAGVAVLAVASAVWRERLVRVQMELLAERQGVDRNRQEALEVNDTILQDVFAARTWLDMGREGQASLALDRALGSTRELVSGLLGEDRTPRPGELVRAERNRVSGNDTSHEAEAPGYGTGRSAASSGSA